MSTCLLWVTLLTPEVMDVLVAGLVRRGWKVGPTADDAELCEFGVHSTLVALSVEGVEAEAALDEDGEESTREHVLLEAAREVLGTYLYFSIVAHDMDGSFEWVGCNPLKTAVAVATPRTALDRVAGDDLEDDP